MTRHTIGLLLGTEDDWPTAFTEILRRLGPVDGPDGPHAFDVERITIEPFSLRDRPRYDLAIDRLAYWYYVPREWLKKVALMDNVYLLNSPFTFQSMEKHAAYCAMMRLGLKVPETVLVPYKNPIDNSRYVYTAARYNQPFDLDAIAQKIGYPLFMKPYDGGAWRGVSRINNADELHAAYDASGEMLMHLQKAIDYDIFVDGPRLDPEFIQDIAGHEQDLPTLRRARMMIAVKTSLDSIYSLQRDGLSAFLPLDKERSDRSFHRGRL